MVMSIHQKSLREKDRTMALEFWKYHGLGNDFAIIDERKVARDWSLATIQELCDRHRGIGADGLLLLSDSEVADFRMIVRNADGSRPEMCGNGLRCFVQYIIDQKLTDKHTLDIETDRGVLTCTHHVAQDSQPSTILVDMGAPILRCPEIPFASTDERWIERPITLDDEAFVGTAVSMGNPHFVIFQKANAHERELAPQLESHEMFPQRANIEFVEQLSETCLDVVVYERGCGFTQACGTGACAVAVAAVLTERIAADQEVEVRLPGGPLWIRVPSDMSTVWMRGPASVVYHGEWALPLS
tara:strand:- start:14704 stop:15603 length:900 start_codon:yes stop_codon:yes gene_type:complete